ncbi:MAG TPA: U32 family peptidase [Candidatus Syntrophoarchaeum butanivorans]|uniref:U32 family peptidase n=1 Tax=Candidatus Syntropharchaeum butanivorans TaxID=1839936 RepID=A0A7C1B5P8_9EURY|nr:MAG: U32 family peptidase [Candidatus Syntrophoarchaeum sp. WYZ-LMO15]HDM36272.1 U32 family peptidase [Candidatus Syntrophoarchaeum butanivorans]
MKKGKFSLPHPGHLEGLKEILRYRVYEIYMGGSPEFIGTGRGNVGITPSIEDVREQVRLIHRKGVKLNIAINSSCLRGWHLTQEGYRSYMWYLSALEEAGVDALTVADPYLVELAKREFKMKVTVSCIAFVNTPEKARFFEKLGADAIAIDPNINRDFETLEGIRASVDCDLKVLVNEGCLYQCPFRYAHFNLISHVHGPEPRAKPLYDYYSNKCLALRVRDPELIIKSPWIRPEDLEAYEEIGIDIFKLCGRTQTAGWLKNVISAYLNRSYEGNLMDLLDAPREIKNLFYIPNKELDGALDRWKVCKKVCKECGYCHELTERVINKASTIPTMI